MGRQVLWGGAGKMPPREVMSAAAKAARGEMMQRIRENKATQSQPRAKGDKPQQPGQQQARRDGKGGNGGKPQGGHHGQRPPKHGGQHAQPPQHHAQRQQPVPQHEDDRDEERMPRNVDPLRTNLPGRRDMTGVRRMNPNGQPDPTRTSIDAMGNSGRRGGGGGGGNGGGRGRGGRGNSTAKTYGR
jgi:ATP-dependent RNA helicase RhlE